MYSLLSIRINCIVHKSFSNKPSSLRNNCVLSIFISYTFPHSTPLGHSPSRRLLTPLKSQIPHCPTPISPITSMNKFYSLSLSNWFIFHLLRQNTRPITPISARFKPFFHLQQEKPALSLAYICSTQKILVKKEFISVLHKYSSSQ